MITSKSTDLMLMLISTAVSLSAHKFFSLLHQVTRRGSVNTPIWLQAAQDNTMDPKIMACSDVSRHDLRKHENPVYGL